MFLSSFAQIILSFEILSLLQAINQINFIYINTFFLIVSLFVFKKTKTELYKPRFSLFFNAVIKGLKKDKLLFLPLLAFILFILLAFIIDIIAPVSISDAMSYHIPRAVNWIVNGSFAHYQTADMRMLTMPINSELLFAWILLFFKSDIAFGMVPFLGYLNTVVVMYCLLGELGFCIRKRLWSVFVFSGLAFVVIEATTCDTNILTGSLILTSLYLFYCGVKYKKNILLFISSLSLAIACGVKTTALIAGPSFILAVIFLSVVFENKQFWKPLLKFSLFFILNFLIFSSYNYILNYINYNDFVTTAEQYELNRFRGGVKGYLSNLIKYFFLLFDYSGIWFMIRFNAAANAFSEVFHLLIGVHANTYTPALFNMSDSVNINTSLIETRVGMGLIGIFAFFPSLFIALNRFGINNRQSLIKVFGLMYIFNILLFAGIMIFTGLNSRYLTTFAVISSPVLVCTYIKSYKNLYKLCLILIMCYYMVFISVQNPYRKVSEIYNKLKSGKNIHQLRSTMRAYVMGLGDNELNFSRVAEYIKTNKTNKIAFFSNFADMLLPIDILKLYGYHIDHLLYENLDNVNIRDYDMIIVHTLYQESDNIIKYYSDENTAELPDGKKVYYDEKNDIACYYINTQIKMVDKNSPAEIPIFVRCQTPFEQFAEMGYGVSAFFPSVIEDISDNGRKDNSDLVVYKRISE